MPVRRLTAYFIERAACPDEIPKIDFFDAAQRGFMIEVRATGLKTFYQRYNDGRGRERQYKLGPASVLTLAQARKLGRRIVAQSILGPDPQSERKLNREIPTVTEFVKERYLPFVQSYKRSWKTDETVLRLHILPVIGRLYLDEVTAGHIQKIASGMNLKSYASGTCGRAIIITRYLFNLACKWKIPGASSNPAAGYPIPADVQRNRFLSATEIVKLRQSIAVDGNQTAAKAIALLLLTGGRRNEITQARWENINIENATLLVPVSKNGKPRLILLNKAALDLLKTISRISDNPFVFPTATGRPCASLHFPWRRIRKRAGLTDVRIHDLRHSFASVLINKGVSLYEVQRLLGHANAKTTQRYSHLTHSTLDAAVQVMSAVFEQCELPPA